MTQRTGDQGGVPIVEEAKLAGEGWAVLQQACARIKGAHEHWVVPGVDDESFGDIPRFRTREDCADDGRGSMVRLTASGRVAIEAAAPERVHTVRRFFFDPLPKKEVDQLGSMLQRMLDRLETDNAEATDQKR